MSLPALSLQCATAAVAGIVAHLTYFIRGEHHRDGPILAFLLVMAPTTVGYAYFRFVYHEFIISAGVAVALVTSFQLGLFSSILVYRVAFHRLNGNPGPFMWRLSKLWHALQLDKLDNYKKLDALHQQYGDYVRVGPAELSIVDPDAVKAILGPGSRCSKSPWYDHSLPVTSMQTTRDKALHSRRRRVWDKAFDRKSLRDYEGIVTGHTAQFLKQMQIRSGQAVNATHWFMYWSFDVMGDIAFGKSFDMVSSSKAHVAVEVLHKGILLVGRLTPLPWLTIIMANLPLPSDFKRFGDFCDAQIERRKRETPERPDVVSYLLDGEPMGDERQDAYWLAGDTRLLVVGGSDTTSVALTYLFYHLALDPVQMVKLRKELDPIMRGQDPGTFDVDLVADCEFLNALIQESLRLHPPVPSSLLRVTPPEGLTIGDHYIPGNITVGIPMTTMYRDPRAFERPLEFIPERWYSARHMVRDVRAFHPFSTGPFACIGKQLAYMELRVLTALLVYQFDVDFAPDEDGSALLNDSKDSFAMAVADLNLVFTARDL